MLNIRNHYFYILYIAVSGPLLWFNIVVVKVIKDIDLISIKIFFNSVNSVNFSVYLHIIILNKHNYCTDYLIKDR